jgi:hypothetical protein
MRGGAETEEGGLLRLLLLGRGPLSDGAEGGVLLRPGRRGGRQGSTAWAVRALTPGILALQLLLVPACGGGPEGDRGAPVVGDSAGVRVVVAAPRHPDATRALHLDADWTPGRELEFGELADLDVTPDGRIVLLDVQAARVTVLDPEGRVEAAFGRPGSGPGELDPLGLSRVVVLDSVVIVPDPAQGRIMEFSLSGEVRAARRIPVAGMFPVEWRSHPAGGIGFRALTMDGPDLLLHLHPGEEGLDTLHTFKPHGEVAHNTLLPPTTLWDLTPERALVSGRSDVPSVEFGTPGADAPTWIVRWDQGARLLTDRDRRTLEDLVSASEEQGRGGGRLGPEARAEVLGRIRMPERLPALARVVAGPDGRIWVRQALPTERMGRDALLVGRSDGWGGEVWDVFEDDGLPAERVRLPEGFEPTRFVGPWIYGLVTDEMGLRWPARVGPTGQRSLFLDDEDVR